MRRLRKELGEKYWLRFGSEKKNKLNMSKIGKSPIEIPEGVRLEIQGQKVKVAGPKGDMEREVPKGISLKTEEGKVILVAKDNDKKTNSLHGTYRMLIANMVKGVSEGWTKELELVGTGYRAEGSGGNITISIGFSHPVKVEAPEGISFAVEKTDIKVTGADKELVGQVAAKIRAIRPPEPYKGKGIKYKDEVVRRKPGKAAKTQGVAA